MTWTSVTWSLGVRDWSLGIGTARRHRGGTSAHRAMHQVRASVCVICALCASVRRRTGTRRLSWRQRSFEGVCDDVSLGRRRHRVRARPGRNSCGTDHADQDEQQKSRDHAQANTGARCRDTHDVSRQSPARLSILFCCRYFEAYIGFWSRRLWLSLRCYGTHLGDPLFSVGAHPPDEAGGALTRSPLWPPTHERHHRQRAGTMTISSHAQCAHGSRHAERRCRWMKEAFSWVCTFSPIRHGPVTSSRLGLDPLTSAIQPQRHNRQAETTHPTSRPK